MAARHPPRKAPNWQTLFNQLRVLYRTYGQDRKAAVLENHGGRKETICRKLGVICEADLRRIESELSSKHKKAVIA